ncbi:MAG: hypothetical protein P4L57_10215 [Rhizomicrobium sp.]|nr:hypothetical protein [Rhizomicrobium sp.]
MRLVYFESLKSDGTIEPLVVPSDRVHIIRPLNPEEAEFSKKLGDGYFGEIEYNPSGSYPLTSNTERQNYSSAQRELRIARTGNKTDVAHPSARSILEVTDKVHPTIRERYCLRQTVEEFAQIVPDIISLAQISEAPTRPGATTEIKPPVPPI